jgi:formylglycine-generating enzyme required for sulfatase activity
VPDHPKETSIRGGRHSKAARCNSVEAGIGGTSDVARFPLGKSASGCADLAGNVWEFVEPADSSYWTCVLRGGSYRNNQHEIKSCLRLVQVSVTHRAPDFGLRCAQIENASESPAPQQKLAAAKKAAPKKAPAKSPLL